MSEQTFQKGVAAPKVKLDGAGLRIAIVHTRWNFALVDQLYKKVYDTLIEKYNVKSENVYTVSNGEKERKREREKEINVGRRAAVIWRVTTNKQFDLTLLSLGYRFWCL